MGREPESLFLYGDSSQAARGVREAIYDGPYDLREFAAQPVILEKIPAVADGDVSLEPVQVQAGDPVIDGSGYLATLADGITYLPSGCNDLSCSQTYSGSQPVSMDGVVVRFKLRPGIKWSDGAALTASDSVYSYEVARSLFTSAQSDLIGRTSGYQALDETTVEWRGVPGYKPAVYASNFFVPLPRHAWEQIAPQDLYTDERSARLPLGWGAYVIDNWVSGDQITLHKNPNYFRSGEGLPGYDRVVFRFMQDGDEAVAALLAGECDFVDETVLADGQAPELFKLQAEGRLALAAASGYAWEHADFNLLPWDPLKVNLFQTKEVRQAIAMCIDRQSLVGEFFPQGVEVSNTYLPPGHPLYAADAREITYDPQAGAALLDSAGWRDTDGDPASPRVAVGVPNIPQDTPLQYEYLTLPGDEHTAAAEKIKSSLVACGVQVEIKPVEPEQLYTPGPDGPIFGRNFDSAQFSWTSSVEPPCFLYTSNEIPGPFPEHLRGWGGANAGGFSNPGFDQACMKARFSLPDSQEYGDAHRQAQEIFAEELPAIPLYLRMKVAAMRSDLCGAVLDPSASSALWNLEAFNSGDGCSR
jgi:peptide/nickel transport system substrate-binding protein